jgi:hypothetical protein
MSSTTTSKTTTTSPQQITDWFDNLLNDIEVDKIQMELGVANKDKAEFYKHLMDGNSEEVFKTIRFSASQALIEKIVKLFVFEVSSRKAFPSKLAFALTPATIRVWAEVNDDDEKCEDEILLAEATVNAYARGFGFSVDTMIVETSDKLPVPSHYKEIKIVDQTGSISA